MKTKTATQAAHLTAALRALEAAERDLAAAGEAMASMRVGSVIAGIDASLVGQDGAAA